MAVLTRTLELTGGHAGKTITLRKIPFVDGKATLTLPEREMESLCRYMAKVHWAFSTDDPRLAQVKAQLQANKEATHGAGEADAQPGQAQPMGQVQGEVQSPGTGPTTAPADNGSGADAAASGGAEQHTDGDGTRGPDGDIDDPTGQAQALQQVILDLDPDNDELWTADGKPRIDAVAAATGRADLTRKVVEAAVPGFERPSHD